MGQRSSLLRLLCGVGAILWFLSASSTSAAETFRLSDYFSRDEIETAARFNRYLYVLFFCRQLVVISFLALVAWSRLASSYEKDIEKACFGKRFAILPVYAFFLLLMIRLVQMPFNAVRDLVVRSAFGLNNQGIPGWLADQAKGFFVSCILYVPFVILVFATLRRLKRTWWLVSAGVVGAGLIVWYSLAPYVVEPLFHRLTPVRSEALRARLDPLLKKSGFPQTALYQADASTKTNEVNAYLSGLFLGRRIVLYDVLAKNADLAEMEFVVAHEIAHWKHEHLLKGIALSTVGWGAVLLLIGLMLKHTAGAKRRMSQRGYQPSALPVFFFWLHAISFLVIPLECRVSRRFETTADSYALELTQNPQAAVRLFQKAAKLNISDLTPSPLIKFWLYTHPPMPERMQTALTAAGQYRDEVTSGETHVAPEKTPPVQESEEQTPENQKAIPEDDGKSDNKDSEDGKED